MITGLFVLILGILSGSLYHINKISELDGKLFLKINRSAKLNIFDPLFLKIYPLGTKWWFIIILVLFALFAAAKGIILLLTAIFMSITEKIVKIAFNRSRPFNVFPGAILRQKTRPQDGSFPSGDACRGWFLAVVSVEALHYKLLPVSVFFLIAMIISLGRVRLGVHYPLDAWTGSIMGAGFGLIWLFY